MSDFLQTTLLHNTLQFAPILFFAVVMWLLSTAVMEAGRVKVFDVSLVILAVSFVGHGAIQVFFGNGIGFPLVQLCAAVILFACLVFFLGDKASGKSLLAMTGVVLLTPVPKGIIGLIAFIVLTIVVSIIKLRSVRKVMNTLESTALTVQNGLSFDDFMQDKSGDAKSASKSLNIASLVLISYFLVAVYYTIMPLLGEH